MSVLRMQHATQHQRERTCVAMQQVSACASACVLERVAVEQVLQSQSQWRTSISGTHDFVLSRLHRIPDVKVATPQGAFYVLPDVSAYYGKSPPDGSQVQRSGVSFVNHEYEVRQCVLRQLSYGYTTMPAIDVSTFSERLLLLYADILKCRRNDQQ
eukprot:20820-Heterococcus_DN1.PRE.2